MDNESDETLGLLQRALHSDESAIVALFDLYREELRRAVILRLDRRISARVDVSDVVQETYLEAARRLPAYLEQPVMPFRLWLLWIAREKVIEFHRQHVVADKRTVAKEVALLPTDSSAALVHGLLNAGPTPSHIVAATELAELLRKALGQLRDDERELILWRHFEQLSIRDIAMLLGINAAAASKRYVRALERLRALLQKMGISSAGG